MEKIDFSPARESGLKIRGELDKLYGVTYAMVNRYLTGKAHPRGKRLARATKVTETLRALVARGSLPLVASDKEHRKASVEKLLAFITREDTQQQ